MSFEDAGATTSPFAFSARAWEAAALQVCYLSEQHRQEDPVFLDLLSAVRRGCVESGHRKTLLTRKASALHAAKVDDIPRLYAHNVDVDRVNLERLAGLPGEVENFEMTAHGPDVLVAAIKRGCLSPEVLSLKKGARVMFTKNNPDGSFVNGTLGEIEDFDEEGRPVVRTLQGRRIAAEPAEWSISDGGSVLARLNQIPLRLAWAITIHKSQGMTMDAAAIDLSQAFEYGQGYVALSRIRRLADLQLLGLNERALEVHPDVVRRDGDFREQSAAVAQEFGKMSEAEHGAFTLRFVAACGGKSGGVAAAADLPSPRQKKKPGASLDETLVLLKDGRSLAQVAQARGLAESTVFGHVGKLHAAGRLANAEVEALLTADLKKALPKIHQTFREHGSAQLSLVFNKLRGVFSYDDLRLARLLLPPS